MDENKFSFICESPRQDDEASKPSLVGANQMLLNVRTPAKNNHL